jgi:inhibitor of KinA
MSNASTTKIFPLGESALVVEFGRKISVELNERSIALADHLDTNPFPGYIESVPCYASTAVFYNIQAVNKELSPASTAFEKVKALIESILRAVDMTATRIENRVIEVPVSFAERDALDLPFVADSSGLLPNEVVEIFTSTIYRVFMLGFLPGFTYMGEVDQRIAVPRKETPRLKMPKGSVGIAGRQTGIYPSESPGGWQIIGRTDTHIFVPESDPPCLFRPGDRVRFIPL